MISISDADTIVAVATPPGQGAIGVVRLSGAKALTCLARVWISRQHHVDNFVTSRIYYGKIRELSTDNDETDIIDEVLVTYFRRPHSYTGEDVVEIHGHGNTYLLERILGALVQAGARLARPGEFTERAYLNGRIDLAQAEAVADLIAASSAAARRCAMEQLTGRLSRIVRRELTSLTELRAFVEATIDFPEEDIEMINKARVAEKAEAICSSLKALAATYQEGRLYREGARVVLVGRPNAGKSSLLNALVGEDRAIVHPMPGTTRDVIEETTRIDGVAIRLIDTAGLRTAEANAVEQIGIDRARRQIDQADLVVLVIDGSVPFHGTERELIGAIESIPMLVALNKNDLSQRTAPQEIARAFPRVAVVPVSATHGDGLPLLAQTMVAQLRGGAGRAEGEGVLVTNARHKGALDHAVAAVNDAKAAVLAGLSAEFVAEHLRQASKALGQIVGEVGTEELLGQIFSRFCIGK